VQSQRNPVLKHGLSRTDYHIKENPSATVGKHNYIFIGLSKRDLSATLGMTITIRVISNVIRKN